MVHRDGSRRQAFKFAFRSCSYPPGSYRGQWIHPLCHCTQPGTRPTRVWHTRTIRTHTLQLLSMDGSRLPQLWSHYGLGPRNARQTGGRHVGQFGRNTLLSGDRGCLSMVAHVRLSRSLVMVATESRGLIVNGQQFFGHRNIGLASTGLVSVGSLAFNQVQAGQEGLPTILKPASFESWLSSE